MTGHEVLSLTGNGLVVWAAVAAVASVIVHARVMWWRTVMGRHLMAYMAVMAAVLVLGVVKLIIGDVFWFAALRLAVFVGVPVAMTQRLWLQIKAQRAVRDVMAHNPPPLLQPPEDPSCRTLPKS